MRQTLLRHDLCSCAAVTRIEVDAERRPGAHLSLRYTLNGAVANVLLPRNAAPLRADGLWQTTCFEAFIQSDGEPGYYEFNFSPSTEWAAYRFEATRSGMKALEGIEPPKIQGSSDRDLYEMAVTLELGSVPALTQASIWRLGLSAVIEERSGGKSYWALSHPAARPDFHHPSSFVLTLPKV